MQLNICNRHNSKYAKFSEQKKCAGYGLNFVLTSILKTCQVYFFSKQILLRCVKGKILRERRLRWFGHVSRSSGAIRTAYDMQIDGKRGAGRPKQTWKKLTEKDCREWKLTTVDPQERSTWRSGVRSAMRAASQLPGKGPTDVDDAPAPAR